MHELSLEIPSFQVNRIVVFRLYLSSNSKYYLSVQATEEDGTPMSLITRTTLIEDNSGYTSVIGEPIKFTIGEDLKVLEKLVLRLEFQGHYAEPPFVVPLCTLLGQRTNSVRLHLKYNLQSRKWTYTTIKQQTALTKFIKKCCQFRCYCMSNTNKKTVI